MKTLTICFFICYGALSQGLYAQMKPMFPLYEDISKRTTIDSGFIRISYAMNAVNIADMSTYDDLQCLDIGKQFSKYYSYFVYYADSTITEWTNENPTSEVVPNLSRFFQGKSKTWSEYFFSEIVKDLSRNTVSEYTRMPPGIKQNYFYTESLPLQKWKIYDSISQIVGYQCQKATCHFRGRDFIAWFAIDIPISNGPWNFGGLPGLILKIYDSEKHYIFECVEVEVFNKKNPIKTYDYSEHRKVDRGKLLKLQKNIHTNYLDIAEIVIVGSKNRTKSVSKIIYHPLELE